MVMTLSIALPLWLSFMLYGWMNNSKHMFANFYSSFNKTSSLTSSKKMTTTSIWKW